MSLSQALNQFAQNLGRYLFAILVFPVFEAPIMQFSPHVRLMADSTPSFLIAEIRRIHVFLITGCSLSLFGS